jgi:hypothetical protein
MKKLEFISDIKNKTLKVPDEILFSLGERNKDIKVILLVDSKDEEAEFQQLSVKAFFEGFDEEDAIYDDE